MLVALVLPCALSLALVVPGLPNPGRAETRAGKPAGVAPQSSQKGVEILRLHCAACHGLDGRGGEHGPDIVTSPKVRGLPDRALFAIINHGVARAGMPAFNRLLGPEEIRSVVAYLRRAGARGASPPVPGNLAAGEALFFGKAGCGDCHRLNGRGGFLGADLSGYGADHSPGQIRSAILHPDVGPGPGRETVTAVTRDGRQWTGVARNEDNFSLQLLDPQGAFHLIVKSDLASLKREPHSLMPDDYASRLSAREIQDLVRYLAGARR